MIQIFSDGGARGNPGPAACAFGVYENKKLIFSDACYLGRATNNVAEYNGVLLALRWLTDNKVNETKEVKFFLDSELVVKQLKGIYKIKNRELLLLTLEIKKISEKNKLIIDFVHIPREQNLFADKMVNEKLDESSRI